MKLGVKLSLTQTQGHPQMAAAKQFTIVKTRRGRETEYTGTLEELIQVFQYTLECGRSYEHEKGNKKINMQPKSAKTLVANIEKAEANSSMNGWSENSYFLK